MPAPNRQQDFRRVAVSLLERGWLSIPLTLDANGFAKKPITPNWTGLARTTETIESLPWAQAHGIGIVLGPASSNLAVLDIDDKGLAEACPEHRDECSKWRDDDCNCQPVEEHAS